MFSPILKRTKTKFTWWSCMDMGIKSPLDLEYNKHMGVTT